MALTPEQVKSLKSQLLSQIENLPQEQKAAAIEQIDSLSPEALELMLKQQGQSAEAQEGIFRMIVSGKVPSALIEETPEAIAVLEIMPISKGHVIIIPKNPVKTKEEILSSIVKFSEKISKHLISKLKAKSCEILTEIKFGEAIIDVIPIYNEPLNLKSPREKASKESLDELEIKLKIKKKPKIEIIKIKKKSNSPKNILKLPRRIP